jgi:hypothetical protein
MSYPLSRIPTDTVGLNLPVVPLAEKVVYYAIGMKEGCIRMLFSLFLAKFFVDVLTSCSREK